MATNPSGLPKPQASDSTAVPYPSPPNSPRQTKPPIPEVPKVSEDQARPAGAVSLAPLRPPKAPLQHSSASTPCDKPEENKHDVSELKTRLGLDSGRCGGLTLSKTPCRSRRPRANTALILSQLGSMIDLTQSSPGLASALDKLVMIVHCKSHNGGPPKNSRIDAWITEFPAGEASTDPTASVEKQIRKVLDLASTECIDIESSTQSCCRRTIGGQRVQNCAVTIAEIVRPEVYLNDAYLEGLLKVLEMNMFCPLHIKKRPLTRVGMWKSSVGEILEKQLPKPVRSNAPQKIGGGLSIPNFRRDLSTYWPAAYDVSPFDITTKSDGPAEPKSSYGRVKSKMMDKLIQDDLISGYVYAYEVQGNSGYVKIGYTARTTELRLEDWKFACNRVPKVLYPIPSGTIAVVSNARRVEALCHAELGHRRIRIYCKCCLKQHLEWFEVSPVEAIAVIQKWSEWMATDPYQSIELRSGIKHTIKEEERKRTRDMDCFMREISKAVKPTLDSGLKVE